MPGLLAISLLFAQAAPVDPSAHLPEMQELRPHADGLRFCTTAPDSLCFSEADSRSIRDRQIAELERLAQLGLDSDLLNVGVPRTIYVSGDDEMANHADAASGLLLTLPQWHEDPDNPPSLSIWPHLIRVAQSPGPSGSTIMLMGVIATTSTSYSGGGVSTARLHLYEAVVAPHAMVLRREVLSVLLRSDMMIRACFSDAEARRRRGVCHDEYVFGANLTLAENDGGALPSLRFEAQTTAYPQTARRGEDSSLAAPLTAADLSHWRDPECSFTRTLRFNPATERYEMDRPAPDCSSYTVP